MRRGWRCVNAEPGGYRIARHQIAAQQDFGLIRLGVGQKLQQRGHRVLADQAPWLADRTAMG